MDLINDAFLHNLLSPLAGNHFSEGNDAKRRYDRLWTSRNDKIRASCFIAYQRCSLL